GIAGQAVRERGRQPLRRPLPTDLRRPRLRAHERRRALLARAARRPHLGGHERDPAPDRRPRPRTPRRPGRPLGTHPVSTARGEAERGGLAPLLRPRSVAVVGASERPGSYGGEALLNLARLGYPGRAYAVNPGRSAVHGVRSYPALEDLPEAPDAV